MRPWTHAIMCVLAVFVNGISAQVKITLVASSPFWMLLQPTATELDFAAIHAIEDSIAASILAMQEGNKYLDMEAIIQQVELLAQIENSPSTTRLRFFVLATTVVEATDNVLDEKQALDLLITVTFTDTNSTNYFLQTIDSAALLRNVTKVAVAPVIPPTSTSGTPTSSLSPLDIVLIVISILIFLGILYMVFEHHRDRGWSDNQRMFNAIEASHTAGHHSHSSYPGISVVDGRQEKSSPRSLPQEASPTSPSTPTSDEVNAQEKISMDEPSSTNPCRTMNVASPPSKTIPLLPPSSQDIAPHSRARNFESNNWFNKPRASTEQADRSSRHENDPTMEANDIPAMSSADSSEDVFHIDINGLSNRGESDGGEDRSKNSSTASAISDWIKSIRVIPGKSKSKSQSSSNVSTASVAESSSASSMAQSSLEKLSLEESMADSFVGNEDEENGNVEHRDEM